MHTYVYMHAHVHVVCCMWRSKCKVCKYPHWWIGSMEFSRYRDFIAPYVHTYICDIYTMYTYLCTSQCQVNLLKFVN